MTDSERYERRYPQTGVSSAQAAERQQRHETLLRTRRVSVVVPALPWRQEKP